MKGQLRYQITRVLLSIERIIQKIEEIIVYVKNDDLYPYTFDKLLDKLAKLHMEVESIIENYNDEFCELDGNDNGMEKELDIVHQLNETLRYIGDVINILTEKKESIIQLNNKQDCLISLHDVHAELINVTEILYLISRK